MCDLWLLTATFFLILSSAALCDEAGISADEIIIGRSTNMSGLNPERTLLQSAASRAYFDFVNAEGGIYGRKIRLIEYDDGNEPKNCVANAKKLIEVEKAFALFEFYGGASVKAIMPLVEKADIPFLMPYSGAEWLRTPVLKNVFNIKSSFYDESEALVAHAVDTLGLKRIGVFYQNDAFGIAGKSEVQRALNKRGLKLEGDSMYERNSTDYREALEKLRKATPQVVITIALNAPAASLMKMGFATGFKPLYMGETNTSDEFLRAVGKEGEGAIQGSAFPLAADTSLEYVKKFRALMKTAKLAANQASLEGYLDARIVVDGLKAAGKDLTRNSFRNALESMDTSIDGFKVKFSPTEHQGSRKIFLLKVKDGAYQTVSDKP